MARRTKEEALATREHILDTAELVFEQRGVSRSSLQEIAEAAGLTRGAIYWHFKDKGDLFNAMMQRVTLPLEEAVSRSDDPALADPVAHIRASMIDALRKTVEDPQVRRVFEIATHKVEYVDELRPVRERHVAMRNACLDHIERGLAAAMHKSLLNRHTPAATAALGLHSLICGLMDNWMLDPGGFDLVGVGTQAIDTFLTGLAGSSPTC